MNSAPWVKWYWADWRSDPRLRMCSLAARGLWAEMLALMHEASPYGHLLVAGRAPTDAQLAVLAGAPSDQIPGLLGDLEAAGVFSRTREGVIYSRRMVRDEKRARQSRKNGKTGGNPSLRKQKEILSRDNPQDKPRDKTQKPEARSQIPPKPPDGGSLDSLLESLIDAAGGNVVHGATGIEVIKPILDLQAMGCDLERDILPAIREAVPRMAEPLRTWGARWLRDAVLAKQAARQRARGAAPPLQPPKLRDPLTVTERKWVQMVTYFRDTGTWSEAVYGPAPGRSGCRAPPDILAQHGYGAAA